MTGSGSRSLAVALAGALLMPSVGLATEELPSHGPAFGDYETVPLLDEAAAYAGPAVPHVARGGECQSARRWAALAGSS